MATIVNIGIRRKYVKLEIDTETRKAAFFQINDGLPEERNEAQIGNEFSDEMYFDRACKQGVDSLLDVLHKFVKQSAIYNSDGEQADDELFDFFGPNGGVLQTIGDNKVNDTPLQTNALFLVQIELDGRRNFVAKSLASMCHRFVAYHMLYRWSVMTMPELTKTYKTQRDKAKLDIQRMIYRKEPPTLD